MGITLWFLWSRDIPQTRQIATWSSSQYSFSLSSCSTHILGSLLVSESSQLQLEVVASGDGLLRTCWGSFGRASIALARRTLSTTLQSREFGLSVLVHVLRHWGQVDSSSDFTSQHLPIQARQKWWPHSKITGSRNKSRHTGQVSSLWSSSSAAPSVSIVVCDDLPTVKNINTSWVTLLSVRPLGGVRSTIYDWRSTCVNMSTETSYDYWVCRRAVQPRGHSSVAIRLGLPFFVSLRKHRPKSVIAN